MSESMEQHLPEAAPALEKDYFVHESAYIDEDVQIGTGTKVWHFGHIQRGARIGEHCSLGQNVNISNNVIIGSGVKIQNNVTVYEGVELEDYVFCGPSMVFTNDLTPRAKYPKGRVGYLKTKVKYGASIGANATIVCGVTLGEWCLIGAGAVVVRDVKAHALMLGSPARQRGWVCECGKVLPGELHCSCGRSYELTETEELKELK
ncbi:UDP-2-acetamido-3-amino-2,3-dideoxy-D-glucuronate N-acetyltransferase [anaerobic digester metagenome]|nr:N-acetyltransferase [Clostridiaceae bacterium HFYG-1003]